MVGNTNLSKILHNNWACMMGMTAEEGSEQGDG